LCEKAQWWDQRKKKKKKKKKKKNKRGEGKAKAHKKDDGKIQWPPASA